MTTGSTHWALAGGHIPAESNGPEPARTSRDVLHLLNTGDTEASVELLIYYADREPMGPYRFKVPARRVKVVRFNDLIDPEAIPLATDYACTLTANLPLVVQYTRLDTSHNPQATESTLAAYPIGG
ncbi:sensory rhodopsin transducer [Rhabdobacter roseus]|uniref:Sensory rhodopsin transducer n=1 Tax=Rhabdobacter roseus TaxID=1655419 RepID=A0A840TUT3_9BACT|nr:sensory rhodopsin transducer [Rhabdobacter roseus]MBB5283439.1 hypothetical protein [Rhabdobacter roseus]